MSAYNSEKFIAESLESIIQQSFSDFELIIFDDASTDATQEIIKNYAAKDKRIVPVFNEQNKGLTVNLNRGISMSRGTYIARMDADDISLPARLDKQVSFLEHHPDIDLLGTASVNIDDSGTEMHLRTVPEMHQEIIKLLPKANPITHPTVMFRKKSFAKINFYNESYRTTQDYEMWFRAAGIGLKFQNINEVLLKYRMDSAYVSRKSFTYRLYDCKLRLQSFKYINLPYYRYYYALIPIILGLIPGSLYSLIKKMDPRMKALN
jgi:glycosyltransferase EpsE